VQLHIIDRQQLDLTAVQLTIIDVLRKEYPARDLFAKAKPDRIGSFDKAAGTDELRKLFQAGKSLDEILEWGARQVLRFLGPPAKNISCTNRAQARFRPFFALFERSCDVWHHGT